MAGHGRARGRRIVHCNLPAAEQAEEVRRVKAHTTAAPGASLAADGRLLVGAAVGTRPEDKMRLQHLLAAGVDLVVIDSSQGDSKFQAEMLRYAKAARVDVVAGNVVTSAQARRLIEAGADGLRVGMGSGSICTTQEVCAGARAGQRRLPHREGRAPARRPRDRRRRRAEQRGGGEGARARRLRGDGRLLFAGTAEAPGDYYLSEGGVRLKRYRGMGSLDAMKAGGSADRYFADKEALRVPQGVSGAVRDRGSLARLLPQLAQGIRHGLRDLGRPSVASLHEGLGDGTLRMELRSRRRSGRAGCTTCTPGTAEPLLLRGLSLPAENDPERSGLSLCSF